LPALLCSVPVIASEASDKAARVEAGTNRTADSSTSKKQAETEKDSLEQARPPLKRVEVGLVDRLATRESYRTIAGKEYLLGPYDELSISVRGPKPETWSVTVSPQGVFEIPLVGVVRCAGMSVAELEKSLTAKLNRYLRNFTLSIIVTRLRGIQVTVTGQVAVPGSYSLPGQASLWEAIQASGGIGGGFGPRRPRPQRGWQGAARRSLSVSFPGADAARHDPRTWRYGACPRRGAHRGTRR